MSERKNTIVVLGEIRGEIENILRDRFDLTEESISEVEERDFFFGVRSLLKPRELTYLAYMLEIRYDIQFGMQEYDDPGFYCLSGLSGIVAEMVDEKSRRKVKS